nr:MAG TPA: hypothetical protein [Caudoviricetes sp.]
MQTTIRFHELILQIIHKIKRYQFRECILKTGVIYVSTKKPRITCYSQQ